MADYEKVYSIKFNVETAVKNLEKLEKKALDIKKTGLLKYLTEVKESIFRIGVMSKKTGKILEQEIGKKAQKNLRALGRESKMAARDMEAIPRVSQKIDLSLSNINRSLNRYVLLPMAAAGAAVIKFSTDMNKGMANVSTLVDKTPLQLEEMKRQAQDTMIAMGKGTQDVTDGLYQVISALGESEENMGQLEGATRAAVAGLADTKSSVEMLTAVAKAYNDTSAESIKHTSDLAFQTVKLGVTTFPELAAAIGKVAPLAAQFNTSQEELFGTMATLTGVTGSTAEVVTQLASSYAAFMKPSEAMEDAVKRINKANKEYNFESAGAMLKTLGYKKTIELLGKAANGSEEELMAMFRRKEAILGILPLISSQSENYTKKVQAMADAAGATDEAFRKQTDGINKSGFQMEQAKQRAIVLSQRLGDKLVPAVLDGVEALEDITDWLMKLDDESVETAISVAKVVAQFVLMMNALRGINAIGNTAFSFIGMANSQFGTFNAGMSGAITKTNALSKAMLGMQKGVSILGALALGYTIGDLINEGIIEPARRKEENKRQGMASRNIDATLRASKMTDEQLDSQQKKIANDLESFRSGNDSAGKRIGLNPAISRFFTTNAELEEREMLEKSSLEAIGAIEREKRRRSTGLPAIESYEQKNAKTLNYFDPTIVRNEQVRQATMRYEYGGSYPDASSFRQGPGYERQSKIDIEANVNVSQTANSEKIAREAQQAFGKKVLEQLRKSD